MVPQLSGGGWTCTAQDVVVDGKPMVKLAWDFREESQVAYREVDGIRYPIDTEAPGRAEDANMAPGTFTNLPDRLGASRTLLGASGESGAHSHREILKAALKAALKPAYEQAFTMAVQCSQAADIALAVSGAANTALSVQVNPDEVLGVTQEELQMAARAARGLMETYGAVIDHLEGRG